MALSLSTLRKPPNKQVVDPSTGLLREEWDLYFTQFTKQLNAAVEAGVINDTVTNALLANMAQSTIKGRAAGAGTGDPQDLTAIQALEILGFAGNDPFTKVLMHCDGTDASTTFTDTNFGGAAKVWTAAGNAQIDTAQSKFGGASGLFDGPGDYVSTPDHADYTLASGDWTTDCWFNCNAAGGAFKRLAGQVDVGAATNSAWFVQRLDTNFLHAGVWQGSSLLQVVGTTQFTNALNTGWHHVAFVRSGATLLLFVDGVIEASAAISGAVNDSNKPLLVGSYDSGSSDDWIGWIDEHRLSSIARWVANFTPPTVAYGPK